MNNSCKIKFKNQTWEFELEGPQDFVKEETDRLLKLTQSHQNIQANPTKPQQTLPGTNSPSNTPEGIIRNITQPHIRHKGLWCLKHPKKDGPEALADSTLIILYAHATIEKRLQLTSLELMRSLKASGFHPQRLDTSLKNHLRLGWLQAAGSRRARRYELSNTGLQEAQRLLITKYQQQPNLI